MAPGDAANRYRGLQRFFARLAEEGEIRVSPMARMKPPHVPIIRVFIDTGARRAEVAGHRFVPADEASNDVDLDQGILHLLGKMPRERVVAVGAKTVQGPGSVRPDAPPPGPRRPALAAGSGAQEG